MKKMLLLFFALLVISDAFPQAPPDSTREIVATIDRINMILLELLQVTSKMKVEVERKRETAEKNEEKEIVSETTNAIAIAEENIGEVQKNLQNLRKNLEETEIPEEMRSELTMQTHELEESLQKKRLELFELLQKTKDLRD